jgi:hypothetical protein
MLLLHGATATAAALISAMAFAQQKLPLYGIQTADDVTAYDTAE